MLVSLWRKLSVVVALFAGRYCWSGGWAFSKGGAEPKISGQILLTFYLFIFLHADFTPQIKTITCLPSKRDPIYKWFSVDEEHLENPEGKQRKFLFLFLYVVAQEGMDLRQQEIVISLFDSESWIKDTNLYFWMTRDNIF